MKRSGFGTHNFWLTLRWYIWKKVTFKKPCWNTSGWERQGYLWHYLEYNDSKGDK